MPTTVRSGSATVSAARSAWLSRCSSRSGPACSTPSGWCWAPCRCCGPTPWAPAGQFSARWLAQRWASLIGAAILIPVGGHDAVLWAVLPVAVLLGGYAPRVISFAGRPGRVHRGGAGPVRHHPARGWKVGIVRIEDVAVGFAISLGVGLVFWPRGAAALLRQNLAAAYSRTADYVAAMVEQLGGLDVGADPGRAGRPRVRPCTGSTTRCASTWPSGRPSGSTRNG